MSFSEEEIKNLKQLLEVEKIRSLRMKYNQLIDLGFKPAGQFIHS